VITKPTARKIGDISNRKFLRAEPALQSSYTMSHLGLFGPMDSDGSDVDDFEVDGFDGFDGGLHSFDSSAPSAAARVLVEKTFHSPRDA